MDKFFIKLGNSDQYSDNRFGSILRDMIVENPNDAIIVFRDHIAIVEWKKDERHFAMYFYKYYPESKETNYFDVYEESRIEKKHECHKWVPYVLMSTFRELYPELKGCDFPVEEYDIWFTDSYSYVFTDKEDE